MLTYVAYATVALCLMALALVGAAGFMRGVAIVQAETERPEFVGSSQRREVP